MMLNNVHSAKVGGASQAGMGAVAVHGDARAAPVSTVVILVHVVYDETQVPDGQGGYGESIDHLQAYTDRCHSAVACAIVCCAARCTKGIEACSHLTCVRSSSAYIVLAQFDKAGCGIEKHRLSDTVPVPAGQHHLQLGPIRRRPRPRRHREGAVRMPDDLRAHVRTGRLTPLLLYRLGEVEHACMGRREHCSPSFEAGIRGLYIVATRS